MKIVREVAFVVAALMGAGAASADVLTFEGAICDTPNGVCSNSAVISQSYGDTATVDVVYSNIQGGTEERLRYWFDAFNDLRDVAWTDGGDGSSIAEIFLDPAAGFEVTLHGFDLGAWPNTSRGSSYRILDGNGTELFASGPLTIGVLGNTHNSFAVNRTSANGLRIQWGPSAFNVGIDNVSFTVRRQGTDVPAPVGLAVLGVVAALLARRR